MTFYSESTYSLLHSLKGYLEDAKKARDIWDDSQIYDLSLKITAVITLMDTRCQKRLKEIYEYYNEICKIRI